MNHAWIPQQKPLACIHSNKSTVINCMRSKLCGPACFAVSLKYSKREKVSPRRQILTSDLDRKYPSPNPNPRSANDNHPHYTPRIRFRKLVRIPESRQVYQWQSISFLEALNVRLFQQDVEQMAEGYLAS